MAHINNIIKNEKNSNTKYEKDTMKMYEAVKNIKRLAPKEELTIRTKEGLTSNEKKQS